jgi:lysophospholipase L1-like esterase
MLRTFFYISLILNILMGALVIFFIHSKGGISYLKEKLHLTSSEDYTSQTASYSTRNSIYKIMPQSKNGIIFLGDSVIEGIEWNELFSNIRIQNRGIGGDWAGGVLLRLDDIIRLEPEKIFIYLGGNDLYRKHELMNAENTADDIKKITHNYEEILKRILEKRPDTKLFILSVIPVNHEWDYVKNTNAEIQGLNKSLETLAEKHGAKYIDLYSRFKTTDNELNKEYTDDGLHLNGKGYLVFKDVIQNYLN